MKHQPAAAQPLPWQRAFVVHVHAAAPVAQGRLLGRANHVLSGQAVHFATLDELLAFIARVLTDLDARAIAALEDAPPPPCDPGP